MRFELNRSTFVCSSCCYCCCYYFFSRSMQTTLVQFCILFPVICADLCLITSIYHHHYPYRRDSCNNNNGITIIVQCIAYNIIPLYAFVRYSILPTNRILFSSSSSSFVFMFAKSFGFLYTICIECNMLSNIWMKNI